MNMRNEWTIGDNETFSDVFYNREESIQSVKDNFDIRRYHAAEGYDIKINGVVERCLVQTSNNPLRELNDYRKIHCPITADVKRGYYVIYEDTVWIIDTNVANIDGAYLSTRMSRCQYLLRWQNSNGDIIEKWGYSSDQTKYSNGETGNSTATLGDNQYALLLPIDEDTKQLKRGMRFAMDFEDSDYPDIYKLTNRKVNLNNELYFDRGGTMTVTLSFDELNRDKDKQIILEDGRKVWICNYKDLSAHPPYQISPPDKTTASLKISYNGSNSISAGGNYKKFTVSAIDSNKNPIDITSVKWTVTTLPENEQFVLYEILDDNSIRIKVLHDDSIIGTQILLSATTANATDSLYIEIGGGI